jgi:hypothetical protein
MASRNFASLAVLATIMLCSCGLNDGSQAIAASSAGASAAPSQQPPPSPADSSSATPSAQADGNVEMLDVTHR